MEHQTVNKKAINQQMRMQLFVRDHMGKQNMYNLKIKVPNQMAFIDKIRS